MLFHKWNWDEALEVRFEEGITKGEARGVAIGEARGEARGMEKVFALLEKGVPLAEVKKRLGFGKLAVGRKRDRSAPLRGVC